MKKRMFLFLLGMLFVYAGCDRSADYLTPTKTSEHVEFPQKIKELQVGGDLDILWVVDNSGSMQKWQDAIIANTEAFMKNFINTPNLQWKMGLVSTDEKDQPYVGFTSTSELDYRSSDPVGIFQAAVGKLGILGSGVEKIFTPIKLQLTNFPSFIRSQAPLGIIVVTDTEDQSPMKPTEIVDFLRNLKGNLSRVTTYAVLGATDFGCEPTDDYGKWNYSTSRHKVLVDATNGKAYKLCDPNFGNNLVDIGSDLVKHVVITARLNLKIRPIPSTIQITYKGKILAPGLKQNGGYWIYDYDANAIIFEDLSFAPGDNEQVEVSFQTVP